MSTWLNRGASGGLAGALRWKNQTAANPLISDRCVFKRAEPALWVRLQQLRTPACTSIPALLP
jgi:hypothetical protein